MVSGSITGAEAKLGAAEELRAGPFGEESEAAPSNGIPRPRDWLKKPRTARRGVWNGEYEGGE